MHVVPLWAREAGSSCLTLSPFLRKDETTIRLDYYRAKIKQDVLASLDLEHVG